MSAHSIALVTIISVCLLAGDAQAQAQSETSYPLRPIRFIVPFPPGSSTDIAARVIAIPAGTALGQNFVIDNRAGASGQIGAELGARAAPDGYTLVIGTTSTHALATALNRKLGYDPQRDFTPLTLIGSSPYVLALHPSVAAANVNELLALARAKPASVRYASAGNATLGHLAGELFSTLASVQLSHVPYKSSALAAPDVLAGRIEMQFGSIPPTLPHVLAGRLRAIAVTGARRLANLATVPTVAESGIPGYEVALWMGIFLPARTPPVIVERLSRDLYAVLGSREVTDVLARHGIDAEASSSQQLATHIANELLKWRKVALAARIE